MSSADGGGADLDGEEEISTAADCAAFGRAESVAPDAEGSEAGSPTLGAYPFFGFSKKSADAAEASTDSETAGDPATEDAAGDKFFVSSGDPLSGADASVFGAGAAAVAAAGV